MFTGIVQYVGTITNLRDEGGLRRLLVDLGPLSAGLAEGDSIAVNGACLTAAGLEKSSAWFDVVKPTLEKTTLGLLHRGGKVNLERALRLDQGLSGHLVQGHIDGVASVSAIRSGGGYVVEFASEPALTDLMVPQGSLAVDGVSLTLIDVGADRFSVALIPTTLEKTTLGALAVGAKVNIETDIIGKYVLKFLGGTKSAGLTLEKLKQAGFA